MTYEEIKKIMDDVGESKLSCVDIEFPDGTKVSLKKDMPILEVRNQEMIHEIPQLDEKKSEKLEYEGNIVKSPMVGTFYSKSSPTANKFVEVGSKVKKGDVLCIIEAMKLMNEIESEFEGEVIKVCVDDGEMVDFGKPLFVIK